MSFRIDSSITIAEGARYATTGHLSFEQGASGEIALWITPNTYTGPTTLLTNLNSVFTTLGSTATWTTGGVSGFGDVTTITWYDEELRDYLGYSGTLSGATSYTTDQQPSATWTPTLEPDWEWRWMAERRSIQDHRAYPMAAHLATHIGERVTLYAVTTDEHESMWRLVKRLTEGETWRVWMDSSNGNPGDWTNANWQGYRDVGLSKMGSTANLERFLAAPSDIIKQLTLDLVEVA